MPCSPITLSLATVAAVVSVALLAIAFSTDNWTHVKVKRSEVEQLVNLRGDESKPITREEFDTNFWFFTRTRGLFRICFPDKTPTGITLYRSPVETMCTNVDYYIPDDREKTKNFDEPALAHLHMARAMIALFIVSFFFDFVAFWTGVVGCWRRSPANITTTAILMLMACLFSAGGMGLWHGVEFYENEKMGSEEYAKPDVFKDILNFSMHEYNYGWSFILAWISVGLSLISSILFALSAFFMAREIAELNKSEHLSYMMPVYPQKQQYAYGYAYPGPYYHGSQYGPYNY